PGVMGLLSVTVFVRLVGYEQYGRYAVLVAVMLACSAGASGWLNQGILRFQSLNAESAQLQSFRRACNVGALLSALFGGAAAAVAVRLDTGNSKAGIAISLALFFFPVLLYTVSLTRQQALLKSRSVVRMESIRAIGSFALPVAMVLITGSKSYVTLL